MVSGKEFLSLCWSIALLLVLVSSVVVLGFGAQYTPATPEWNKPVKAFRIIGNIYYVGASEVSSFLITTPKGHILAIKRSSSKQREPISVSCRNNGPTGPAKYKVSFVLAN